MIYDREDVEKPRAVKFTHAELEALTEAAKCDEDVRKATVDKLKALTAYARTKAAYAMGDTIITAQ